MKVRTGKPDARGRVRKPRRAWLWYYFGDPSSLLHWTREDARRFGGGYGWALRSLIVPAFRGKVPPP